MNNPELIDKILPPNNYEHREGFSNHQIIDDLDIVERIYLEDELINMLLDGVDDQLIIETLGYMKSKKSIPVLIDILERKPNSRIAPIVIASAIYNINHDERMIDIAIEDFRKHQRKFDLIWGFCYLKKFKNEKANNVIREYVEHPEFLVSYNAKRALGLIKDQTI